MVTPHLHLLGQPLSLQRVVISYQRVTLKRWKQENLPPQGLLFRHLSQGPSGTSHEVVAWYTSSATRPSSTSCIFIKSQPGFFKLFGERRLPAHRARNIKLKFDVAVGRLSSLGCL